MLFVIQFWDGFQLFFTDYKCPRNIFKHHNHLKVLYKPICYLWNSHISTNISKWFHLYSFIFIFELIFIPCHINWFKWLIKFLWYTYFVKKFERVRNWIKGMYWVVTGRLLQMEEERSLQGYYKASLYTVEKDEVKLVQEENQEFLFVCIRHRIYFFY